MPLLSRLSAAVAPLPLEEARLSPALYLHLERAQALARARLARLLALRRLQLLPPQLQHRPWLRLERLLLQLLPSQPCSLALALALP